MHKLIQVNLIEYVKAWEKIWGVHILQQVLCFEMTDCLLQIYDLASFNAAFTATSCIGKSLGPSQGYDPLLGQIPCGG